VNKKYLPLFFALLLPLTASALEIDSQLTVRLLRLSQSKKTILINRGSEDGLAENDHAKFFLTEGVVARAVVIELAPNRSIWSVYRLVNPELLHEGEVMDLKISQPLDITSDETKAIFSRGDAGLDFNQGAVVKDLPNTISNKGEAIDPMGGGVSQVAAPAEASPGKFKSIEVFTSLSYQRLSSEVSGNNGSQFDSTKTNAQFSLGTEFYFSVFSIAPVFNYSHETMSSYEGALTESSMYEFAGVAKAYLIKPNVANKFFPYLKAGYGVGKITDSFSGGERLTGQENTSTAEGTTKSFQFGLGTKYYFNSGFGVFLELDYYSRKDTFDGEPDTNNVLWDRVQSGPRFGVSLAYRF
jgi:opacity protein-like surface antigen